VAQLGHRAMVPPQATHAIAPDPRSALMLLLGVDQSGVTSLGMSAAGDRRPPRSEDRIADPVHEGVLPAEDVPGGHQCSMKGVLGLGHDDPSPADDPGQSLRASAGGFGRG
jgi:hypothetical protein